MKKVLTFIFLCIVCDLMHVETLSASTIDYDTKEYVNLGLPSGTLWATCNIGAATPEEAGNYYAWGEVDTKSSYTISNYKWCSGSVTSLTKYCSNPSYGIVDNLYQLEKNDDAAYVNWGPEWRTPSISEVLELERTCKWNWTTVNGIDGYNVVGPNGNSIFLPTTGWMTSTKNDMKSIRGCYWSGTGHNTDCIRAKYIHFKSDSIEIYGSNLRYFGQCIRPVASFKYGLTLNHQYLNLSVDESATLIASILPNDARAILTCSNENVVRLDKSGQVTAMAPGTSTIIAYADDGSGRADTCHIMVTGLPETAEPVDLGLSSGTLWANMNIGASYPGDIGGYFAWGETEIKDKYDFSTYKYCEGNLHALTKYNDREDYGYVDSLYTLENCDDAAFVNWGEEWKTPSYDQLRELMDECSWDYDNDSRLIKATGRNGKYIVFPITGYYNVTSLKYYSPEEYTEFTTNILSNLRDDSIPERAYMMVCRPDTLYMLQRGEYNYDHSCFGRSVRAVYATKASHVITYLDYDGSVFMRDTLHVGDKITLPFGPERTGYTFSGWIGDVFDSMPTTDLTFKAGYSINSYNITYIVGDAVVHVDSYEYNAPITLFNYIPEDSRFEFVGWESEDGDVYAQMPSHDIVFHAIIADDIESVLLQGKPVNVFSISGTPVKMNVTSSDVLKSLPKGLYVVDKKIFCIIH